MCENAYLSIKNPKASRALKRALDPGCRMLASLARLSFAMSATFGLRSWGPPLDQILDPHLYSIWCLVNTGFSRLTSIGLLAKTLGKCLSYRETCLQLGMITIFYFWNAQSCWGYDAAVLWILDFLRFFWLFCSAASVSKKQCRGNDTFISRRESCYKGTSAKLQGLLTNGGPWPWKKTEGTQTRSIAHLISAVYIYFIINVLILWSKKHDT